MKTQVTKILIALVVISSAVAGFAATPGLTEKAYQLPKYTVEDLTLPVPSKIVSPRLGGNLVGRKVRMSLNISADGRATGISQIGISPDQATNDLAATMKVVLRHWKFDPALNNFGRPVAVKVILPVEVVKKNKKPTLVASLILDTRDLEES